MGRVRSIVVFLALVWLWQSVLGDRAAGGYDRSGIFSYLLVASLLSDLIYRESETWIAEDITDGWLSHYLVRPIGYFWSRVVMEFLPYSVIVLSTLPVQYLLFRLVFPKLTISLSLSAALSFLPSVLLAYAIMTLIDFLVGCTAFWMHRAHGLRWLATIVIIFGTGIYIPLHLLPSWLFTLLSATPLPSIIYAPTMILTGGFSGLAATAALVTQAMWIILLAVLSAAVWRRGLKRYEAIGI